MRITPIAILLVTATSAAAQQPPRRAENARALRALMEAQVRAMEDQRALLETQQARTLEETARLREATQEQLARTLYALEAAGAHTSREAERRALEAQLQASTLPEHGRNAERALLEAALLDRTTDDLAADARLEALLDEIAERGVPEAWAPQDPADSLYRAGREQLNAGEYGRAARTFERIRTDERFRRSQYLPAAHYWEAFALSRTGSMDDLHQAREILRDMRRQFVTDVPGIGDAAELAATIDARLARQGDARARAELAHALAATTVSGARTTTTSASVASARAEAAREAELVARGMRAAVTAAGQRCPDDDIRTVALNALLRMDPDEALPLLREVMERRDECSVHLRRRAMMMLAERPDAEAQAILIEAALGDPDAEVREQATFWLSHVPGDAAVEALARILVENPTPAVRERAIFALGQQQGSRAAEILREYALREDLPDDLRRQIVFSLAHSSNAANADFLRQLYERTSDPAVRQQIVMTLSQDPSPETADWILRIATDSDEPVEVRRQALLMIANAPDLDTQRLVTLYDDADDAEMRRHVLMVLAQRVHSDPAAVGKLVDIARTTDDVELQRMIVYMLSESRDPRAVELMAEIVRRPIR